MAKEREIVDMINDELVATQFASDLFKNSKFYNIAELVKTSSEDDGEETKPVLIDSKGNAVYVGLDDRYPTTSYHRMINITEEELVSYGYREHVRAVAEMRYVFIGHRNKTQLSKEDFITMVQLGFPRELRNRSQLTNVSEAYLEISGFDLDKESVYNEEFNLEGFYLKPQTVMFALNYTIETVVDRLCLTVCE